MLLNYVDSFIWNDMEKKRKKSFSVISVLGMTEWQMALGLNLYYADCGYCFGNPNETRVIQLPEGGHFCRYNWNVK